MCSVRRALQEAFQTRLMPIFAVHTPHARASDVLWPYLARPTVTASVGTVFLGNHVSVENTTQLCCLTSMHSLSSYFLCLFVFSICRFHSAATQEFSTQSPCRKSEQWTCCLRGTRHLAYLPFVHLLWFSSRSISEEANSHCG